jgi:hypothetical protein
MARKGRDNFGVETTEELKEDLACCWLLLAGWLLEVAEFTLK